MTKYKEYEVVKLKDGRTGDIVAILGDDYVIDIKIAPGRYDTNLISESEIEGKIE